MNPAIGSVAHLDFQGGDVGNGTPGIPFVAKDPQGEPRAVAGLLCSRPPGRARGGIRGAMSGTVMAASPREGPRRPGGPLAAGLRVERCLV